MHRLALEREGGNAGGGASGDTPWKGLMLATWPSDRLTKIWSGELAVTPPPQPQQASGKRSKQAVSFWRAKPPSGSGWFSLGDFCAVGRDAAEGSGRVKVPLDVKLPVFRETEDGSFVLLGCSCFFLIASSFLLLFLPFRWALFSVSDLYAALSSYGERLLLPPVSFEQVWSHQITEPPPSPSSPSSSPQPQDRERERKGGGGGGGGWLRVWRAVAPPGYVALGHVATFCRASEEGGDEEEAEGGAGGGEPVVDSFRCVHIGLVEQAELPTERLWCCNLPLNKEDEGAASTQLVPCSAWMPRQASVMGENERALVYSAGLFVAFTGINAHHPPSSERYPTFVPRDLDLAPPFSVAMAGTIIRSPSSIHHYPSSQPSSPSPPSSRSFWLSSSPSTSPSATPKFLSSAISSSSHLAAASEDGTEERTRSKDDAGRDRTGSDEVECEDESLYAEVKMRREKAQRFNEKSVIAGEKGGTIIGANKQALLNVPVLGVALGAGGAAFTTVGAFVGGIVSQWQHRRIDSEVVAAVKNKMWVPDKERKACSTCAVSFTLLRRRHHCRKCGGLYCRRCLSKRWVRYKGVSRPRKELVCFNCARQWRLSIQTFEDELGRLHSVVDTDFSPDSFCVEGEYVVGNGEGEGEAKRFVATHFDLEREGADGQEQYEEELELELECSEVVFDIDSEEEGDGEETTRGGEEENGTRRNVFRRGTLSNNNRKWALGTHKLQPTTNANEKENESEEQEPEEDEEKRRRKQAERKARRRTTVNRNTLITANNRKTLIMMAEKMQKPKKIESAKEKQYETIRQRRGDTKEQMQKLREERHLWVMQRRSKEELVLREAKAATKAIADAVRRKNEELRLHFLQQTQRKVE
ncbi:GTP-binding protein Rheb isoform 1 [Balamuthia mandrillaris]